MGGKERENTPPQRVPAPVGEFFKFDVNAKWGSDTGWILLRVDGFEITALAPCRFHLENLP